MVIGLIVFAIATLLIGALLVRLAVHALPACCAFLAAQAVHASGAGLEAVIAAGALAVIATLALAQIILASARSPTTRIAVGLAFALPAGLAGYHAVNGVAAAIMPALLWQQMLPMIAAATSAAMAWMRLGCFNLSVKAVR